MKDKMKANVGWNESQWKSEDQMEDWDRWIQITNRRGSINQWRPTDPVNQSMRIDKSSQSINPDR